MIIQGKPFKLIRTQIEIKLKEIFGDGVSLESNKKSLRGK